MKGGTAATHRLESGVVRRASWGTSALSKQRTKKFQGQLTNGKSSEFLVTG